MATTTASPAQTEKNAPDALRQEQRAGIINEIGFYLKFVTENDTPLADLMILREVLCIAHSNGGSILTGIGAALNRDQSDSVWVRMSHQRGRLAIRVQSGRSRRHVKGEKANHCG